MARRDETNPFNDEEKGAGPGSKPHFPSPSSLPLGFDNKHDAIVDIPLETMNDTKKKGKELSTLEEDLRKREMDIKRREDALSSGGVSMEVKNWPPFFPIIHHDIAKEIPVHAQRLQYLAFASWLGIVLCLVWNVIAVFVYWMRGGGVITFFFAAIYTLLGCPLSYVLWYKRLYCAMRADSTLQFGCFFLVYLFHIGFCIFAAIAPPILFMGKSLTGILAAIDALSGQVLVEIFYFIGFGLFCLETLISLGVLQQVSFYFRRQQ